MSYVTAGSAVRPLPATHSPPSTNCFLERHCQAQSWHDPLISPIDVVPMAFRKRVAPLKTQWPHPNTACSRNLGRARRRYVYEHRYRLHKLRPEYTIQFGSFRCPSCNRCRGFRSGYECSTRSPWHRCHGSYMHGGCMRCVGESKSASMMYRNGRYVRRGRSTLRMVLADLEYERHSCYDEAQDAHYQ